MKKAFTLFEMVITLIIFAFLAGFLSKALQISYENHFKFLRKNSLLLELNSAILSIEKIFNKCLEIHILNQGFTCLLFDDENIFSLENKKLSLLNPALILEQNGTFYMPKAKLKTILQNRQILFGDKENKLYFYAHNNLKILEVLNDTKINAKNFSKGFAIPLQARADLILKNGGIIYELRPKINTELLKQTSILALNISDLTLEKKQDFYILKICIQKETKQCLEKILL